MTKGLNIFCLIILIRLIRTADGVMRKTARKIGISLDDFTKLFFERRFKRRAESHDLYFQENTKR